MIHRFLPAAAAVSVAAMLIAPPAARAGEPAGQPAPLPPAGAEHAVERTIGPGEIHTYVVELEAGHRLEARFEQRGVDVVVTSFGPSGEPLGEHDSPNGTEGPEPVELTAAASGVHRLEVRPYEGEEGGRYEVVVDAVLTPEQIAARAEEDRARQRAAVEWLAGHAIRLAGPDPGRGFEDMEPLRGLIGDARVVALGEATHGSRELFQVKHRMLEFLVERMGFTAFAIEATMPESFDVDRYVLTGEGDPGKALSGLYFWTWDTAEVLALIEWMRGYNADPGHERKVRFYGFDMQMPVRAARVALAYLDTADPEAAGEHRRALAAVADPFLQEGLRAGSEAGREAAHAAAERLAERLDRHRDEYAGRTGGEAWELARQHARVLVQSLEQQVAGNAAFAARDRAMAENALWILDREGPDGKVVLWAHNRHVSTAEPWMGSHLRAALGDDLVVFGLAFDRGGFQARGPAPDGGGMELRDWEVGAAEPETLDGTLAAAGLETAAIDLRALPESGAAAEWLRAPIRMRSIGAAYDPSQADSFYVEAPAPELYDALLFVRGTTPARRNPWLDREDRGTLPAPANLDFEEGDEGERAGGIPSGWNRRMGLEQFAFEVGTDGARPYSGRRSATVRRVSGDHYGEMVGILRQRIDASSVQGKTVRLRAAVRAETPDPDSAAHLMLLATGGELAFQDSRRADTAGRPIRDTEWRVYELTVEVPEGAGVLEYGLALNGAGQAWFDSVALEEVVENLPPTCLPPTVPNCGLLYDCPASAPCCSRWEATEYCCKTPPINGALLDDGGKGDCLPPAP